MSSYDRASELKAFDETKAGVKGLVDAGVTTIPRFFHTDFEITEPFTGISIPVVDLQGPRQKVVAEVKYASETFGFFQVVNHGVPVEAMDEMREGVRRFMEDNAEAKAKYYTRDPTKKVRYFCNFDLYSVPSAHWKDTLNCFMAPDPPRPEELPLACRDITIRYTSQVQKLARSLFELLSEALGLKPHRLEDMDCNKGLINAMHYYPPCPEPHLTLGTNKHSDGGFLTILMQDHIGGLQVLHEDRWIDVPPVPGALVINIGDLLQLISNDKLKSVEHRVLANKTESPRISVACFLIDHIGSKIYGPIDELVSKDNPPIYKHVTGRDYHKHFYAKGLDGKKTLDHYRL